MHCWCSCTVCIVKSQVNREGLLLQVTYKYQISNSFWCQPAVWTQRAEPNRKEALGCMQYKAVVVIVGLVGITVMIIVWVGFGKVA